MSKYYVILYIIAVWTSSNMALATVATIRLTASADRPPLLFSINYQILEESKD